jgi:FkbM family methyltransferase
MNTTTRRKAVVLLVGAVLALAAVAALLAVWPPAHGLVLYVKGRAGTCTPLQALRSRNSSLKQVVYTNQIREGSRVVREENGFRQWQTPRGAFWIPANSETAMEYDLGEQARQIYGGDEKGVKPGDVVLDCGANVGVFTREALSRGARMVIAIEPGPENVECLRRNFPSEIAMGKVVVYPKGVWDRDDMLSLSVDPKNSARDSFLGLGPGTTSVQVPLTTIDKLVPELKLPRVDFIKMDIEGAEQKALNGGRATIVKYQPRMAVCVYHQRKDPVEIPRLVKQIRPGYRTDCGCMLYDTDDVQPQVAFFY